ncbi:MAG: sulfatase-like hydrolase/transferase [Oscillospiraceae bacterium]|nr:sulfatase-like hydrolase/transferase [Oscillospiraceae bacterium]
MNKPHKKRSTKKSAAPHGQYHDPYGRPYDPHGKSDSVSGNDSEPVRKVGRQERQSKTEYKLKDMREKEERPAPSVLAPPPSLSDLWTASTPLVKRQHADIPFPDASAGNIKIYQSEKPKPRTGKALPPVPLTTNLFQLEEPSHKRKGQRQKGKKSIPLQLVEPEPEPPPTVPPPRVAVPTPISLLRWRQELKEGERSLARRKDSVSEAAQDLPWLPNPNAKPPAPPPSVPLSQQVSAFCLNAVRAGAVKAKDLLFGTLTRVFLFLVRIVVTAFLWVRGHLPPLPPFLRKRRRYRGRLRVSAWSQWRAFCLSSLFMGLAVTGAVEAVRVGNFMDMCAWAAERMGSFFLSGVLYGAVVGLLGAVIGKLWVSGLLVSILGLAAALVNHFKLRIDGTPLVLSDFGLVGQAGDVAGVAGELSPPGVFWHSVWFLTFCVLTLFFLSEWTRTRGADRLMPVLLSAALTFCLFSAGMTISVGALFHVDVAERLPPATNHRLYGLTVSLWRELLLQKISPPDGYSLEQMREVLQEVDALTATPEPAEGEEVPPEKPMPNVLVILSESFFDVNRLPGVTYDRDPVENFHALQAESISGRFYSHYLGYGTGYIEMSMQSGIGELDLDAGTNICFMPDETYELFDALAEQYTNLGTYTAEMLHAYDNSLYNRTVTYPLMGYSKSLYSEDIRALGIEWNGNLYGGYYMKDSYFFQAMRHEMEKINESGQKAFLYGITMENHQPFNPDKFNGVCQVKVTAPKLKRSELEILKVGVEGIVRADAALKELTDALREYPVPTIVAFFGDHRPTLPMPNGRTVYTQLGLVPGGDTSLWTEEQIGDIYSSDYLIWANDAALLQGQAGTRKHAGVLSFGPMVLELTGQPLTRWWKLACLSAKVQLVSREVYFVNGKGEPFFTQARAQLSEEEEHLLYLRSCVLYDALYGERYITREMNRAGP